MRLAASLTIGEYLLPDLLARWKLDHPLSPVRLLIGNTSEVIAAVAAFEADMGFIEGPRTHPAADRAALAERRNDHRAAAPSHALAGRTASVRDLREATWALREPGSGTREAADRWLLERVGSLRVEFELGSPEAIKRLVAAGSALACLSREVVARELAQGALVELATRLPRATRRLAMVLHRDKHLGRSTDNFVRHCAAFATTALAAFRAPSGVAGPDQGRWRGGGRTVQNAGMQADRPVDLPLPPPAEPGLLAEIAAGLATSSDLNQLVARFLDRIVRLAGAQAGTVRVLSDAGDQLQLVSERGPARRTCAAAPAAVDRHCGHCGRAAADAPGPGLGDRPGRLLGTGRARTSSAGLPAACWRCRCATAAAAG